MRSAYVRLLKVLLRAAERLDVIGKTPRRVVRGVSYALLAGGAGMLAYGAFEPSIHPAFGISLLGGSVLGLAMMEKTKEISENLYGRLDRLQGTMGTVVDGVNDIKDTLTDVHTAVTDVRAAVNNNTTQLQNGFAMIADKLDRMTASIERMSAKLP